MEIKIELDLPAIIANAVSAEKVQPIVDKAVSECIRNAIEEATGYRSTFRDEVKKQLADLMPHGLDISDIAKFQHVFNAAITAAVTESNSDTIQAGLKKVLEHVIPQTPRVIKLSAFMEAVRTGLHKEDHEAFYAVLEMSEYGGGHLYFDDDESIRNKYSADYRVAFNKGGEVYSLHMDGSGILPSKLPNVISNLDSLLMTMYTGRTTLEVDMSEDDVEYAAQSKDD